MLIGLVGKGGSLCDLRESTLQFLCSHTFVRVEKGVVFISMFLLSRNMKKKVLRAGVVTNGCCDSHSRQIQRHGQTCALLRIGCVVRAGRRRSILG